LNENEYRQKLKHTLNLVMILAAWANIFAVFWYWTLVHSSKISYVLFVLSFLVYLFAVSQLEGDKNAR